MNLKNRLGPLTSSNPSKTGMDPILQTELNTAFTSQLGSHVGEPGTLCIKTWGTLSHTFFPEAPGPPYSVFLCEDKHFSPPSWRHGDRCPRGRHASSHRTSMRLLCVKELSGGITNTLFTFKAQAVVYTLRILQWEKVEFVPDFSWSDGWCQLFPGRPSAQFQLTGQGFCKRDLPSTWACRPKQSANATPSCCTWINALGQV